MLSTSATFAGIDYNARKVEQGRAALIERSGFGWAQDLPCTLMDDKQYMLDQMALNPRCKKGQFHFALSCRGREYTFEQLTDLAHQVLDHLGYGGQPTLIFAHTDTDNNHIHVICPRVTADGKRIDSNREAERAKEFLDQLLVREVKQVPDIKREADHYRFTSVEQFIYVMRSLGCEASHHVPNRDDYGKIDGMEYDPDNIYVWRNAEPVKSYPVAEIQKCAKKTLTAKQKGRAAELKRLVLDLRRAECGTRNAECGGRSAERGTRNAERGGRNVKIRTRKEFFASEQVRQFIASTDKEALAKAGMTEEDLRQLVLFREEARERLGITICYQRDRNGVPRGLSIVDPASRAAYLGSEILGKQTMRHLLDPTLEERQQAEAAKADQAKDATATAAKGTTSAERKADQAKTKAAQARDMRVRALCRMLAGIVRNPEYQVKLSWSVDNDLFLRIGNKEVYKPVRTADLQHANRYGVDRDVYLMAVYFPHETFRLLKRDFARQCKERGVLPNAFDIDTIRINKTYAGDARIEVCFKGEEEFHSKFMDMKDFVDFMNNHNRKDDDWQERLRLVGKYLGYECCRHMLEGFEVETLERGYADSHGMDAERIFREPDWHDESPEVSECVFFFEEILVSFIEYIGVAFSAPGGSRYANREYEVGQGESPKVIIGGVEYDLRDVRNGLVSTKQTRQVTVQRRKRGRGL